jgi:hypothetical protein
MGVDEMRAMMRSEGTHPEILLVLVMKVNDLCEKEDDS